MITIWKRKSRSICEKARLYTMYEGDLLDVVSDYFGVTFLSAEDVADYFGITLRGNPIRAVVDYFYRNSKFDTIIRELCSKVVEYES